MKFLGELELQDSLGIFLILRNIDLSIKCTKYTQSTYCSIFTYMGVKNFFEFDLEGLKYFLFVKTLTCLANVQSIHNQHINLYSTSIWNKKTFLNLI